MTLLGAAAQKWRVGILELESEDVWEFPGRVRVEFLSDARDAARAKT